MKAMTIQWIEKYLTDAEHLIISRQVDEGLELLTALLYDEPGYGSLHNHLGWAYMYYTDDVIKAERHLKLAIYFDEAFHAPYLLLGNLYVRLARYTEAIAIFEKGLTKPSANRIALFEGIGHAYELQKEYAKAVKAYKEALSSTIGFDHTTLTAGIQRCRKKRWVMMF